MSNLFDDLLRRRWDSRRQADRAPADSELRRLQPGRELWLPPAFDTIPETSKPNAADDMRHLLERFTEPGYSPGGYIPPPPPTWSLPPVQFPGAPPRFSTGIDGWQIVDGIPPDLIA